MNEPTNADAPARIDLANADLLLSTTRSVRKRLDFERPVEREVLLECLRLAVQAPTASNRQTWRWVIVTEPELKAKIADYYREAAGALGKKAKVIARDSVARCAMPCCTAAARAAGRRS